MMDNELILFDRLAVIKDVVKEIGEEKVALSFSGGKDSTIVHHLLDMAIPNNKIKRVFIDTGIEYNLIKKFVLDLQAKDNRIEIIKPTKSIMATLETYGYPFKSKQHSHNLGIYQNSGMTQTNINYLGKGGKTKFLCPYNLEYQFNDNFQLKVSAKCCLKLKKEPAKKWEKANNIKCYITGMRKEEGGQRTTLNCVNRKGKDIVRFHPLAKVDEKWCDWFVETYKIELCKLYYPPYNFKRTGCKGCPFALDLQEQLSLMELYMPNERKQCEIIWKKVYDEYRKLNYRLDKNEQGKLL